MFILLAIITSSRKLGRCPSTVGWINKLWMLQNRIPHITEKKIIVHAAISMKIMNMVLSNEASHKRDKSIFVYNLKHKILHNQDSNRSTLAKIWEREQNGAF